MNDKELASLLGEKDALEVGRQLRLMKDRLLAANDISEAEKQIEEILSGIYFSTKAKYPEIFNSPEVEIYRRSLANHLKRTGYLPHSPANLTTV